MDKDEALLLMEENQEELEEIYDEIYEDGKSDDASFGNFGGEEFRPEPPVKSRYGPYEKIRDIMWVSSKQEKRITAALFSICFGLSFYMIFISFVKAMFRNRPISQEVDFSPVHFFHHLFANGTPQTFLTALVLALLIGCFVAKKYVNHLNLKENNGVIRAKNGIHGSAKWITSDPKQLRETFERTDEKSKPGYVIIGNYKGYTYSVRPNPKHNQVKNFNICGIGASGSGKTFGIFGPMIQCRIAYGESFVATDTKGDIYRKYAHLCETFGYKVYVLNTESWKNSDPWNCLDEITNSPEAEVYNRIDIMANTFMNNPRAGDFWSMQETALLKACLHLITRDSKFEGRRTFIELIRLINSKEKEIRSLMETSDPKVRRAIQSVLSKDNANVSEDVRSGLSAKLDTLSTPVVAEALSYDGINAEDAVHGRTAIFVITRDDDSTYHAITSLFIGCMYRKLVEISNSKKYRGKLKIPFWFILDELCNMAEIPDLSSKISTNRSRRINFCLCIQSKSQLDQKYLHLADNILSNCGIVTFLGSDDKASVQAVVDRCGKYTQVVKTVMRDVPITSKIIGYVPFWRRESTSYQPKNLIEFAEADKFESGEVIQMVLGKDPFHGTTYPETDHFLYQFIENKEPSDHCPQWYEEFCEKYPEYREDDTIRHEPSSYELRGVEGPTYEPPKKKTQVRKGPSAEDRIRTMFGEAPRKRSEAVPASAVREYENTAAAKREQARKDSEARIREAFDEPKPMTQKPPASGLAFAAAEPEPLRKAPEKHVDHAAYQDQAVQEMQDFTDISATHYSYQETDAIGGDHTFSDFDPLNDGDAAALDALF